MAGYSSRVDGNVGLTLNIEPTDWKTLADSLREFAVEDVKRSLEESSPDGGPDTHEYRDMLAAAAKVSLSFAPRTAGVSISTNNKQIPVAHQAIMRAYNKGTFRHPVFGTDDWVTQQGRPYFGQVFEQMVFRIALEGVNRALGNATAALARYRSNS